MSADLVIKFCEEDAEILEAFQMMQQLRPHLDKAVFVERVRHQMQSGYRQAIASLSGKTVGVVGYRFLEDLAWGLTLYVDDLVVDEACRGNGYGQAMMEFIEGEGMRRGCETLRLSSGLTREPAHLFYERFGMTKSSFSFIKKLDV